MGKGAEGQTLFLAPPSVKRIRLQLKKFCRKDDVALTRLKLGHCGLANYLKVNGKHTDGLHQCGSAETVQRAVFGCNKHGNEKLLQLFRVV